MSISPVVIEQLRQAIKELEPPFLALPEAGGNPVILAYRRGARDAYQRVLDTLLEEQDE
jgi:hypothetical protein